MPLAHQKNIFIVYDMNLYHTPKRHFRVNQDIKNNIDYQILTSVAQTPPAKAG